MSTAIRTGIRCFGIFVGGLVLLTLFLLAVLLPWQERHSAYQRRIEQLTTQLQHYNSLIAAIPALEQQLAGLHSNKELDTYYISAADGAAGGIALQRQIEEFAKTLNISLSSEQVLPPEDQPSATKVGLRLRFGCSIDALWQLLYSIEASKPLLIITVITVRAMRQGPRQRYPGSIEDTTPDLNVNLDVYGYIRRAST